MAKNKNTIEFLGIWEKIYNPDFKPVEFDGFKKQAGLNRFVLSVKQWYRKMRYVIKERHENLMKIEVKNG